MDVCGKEKAAVAGKKESSCRCFGKSNETRCGRVREDGEKKCVVVRLFMCAGVGRDELCG